MFFRTLCLVKIVAAAKTLEDLYKDDKGDTVKTAAFKEGHIEIQAGLTDKITEIKKLHINVNEDPADAKVTKNVALKSGKDSGYFSKKDFYNHVITKLTSYADLKTEVLLKDKNKDEGADKIKAFKDEVEKLNNISPTFQEEVKKAAADDFFKDKAFNFLVDESKFEEKGKFEPYVLSEQYATYFGAKCEKGKSFKAQAFFTFEFDGKGKKSELLTFEKDDKDKWTVTGCTGAGAGTASTGYSTGTIVIIVIVALVLAALAIGGGYYYYAYVHNKKETEESRLEP